MGYTYSTLVVDIVANMEEDSTEFTSALPSIIERAQGYLQRRADPINILRHATVSVSASSRTADLPSDVLVLKSVQLATDSQVINLLQQTNEYLTAYWPVYTSVATPKYYAAKDNSQIFLAPTPVSSALATIEYVAKVTVLTSALPSNWFSENADSAFFAAAMMYANMWAKNSSAIQFWKGLADEEIAAINNEARRSRRSDTVDRSGGTPENNIGEGVR